MQGGGGKGNFSAMLLNNLGDFQQHVLFHLVILHPDCGFGEGVHHQVDA